MSDVPIDERDWQTIVGSAESGLHSRDIRCAIRMLMERTKRSAVDAGHEVRAIIGILHERRMISDRTLVGPLRNLKAQVEQEPTTQAKFEFLRSAFGTEHVQSAIVLAANADQLYTYH